MRIPEPPWDLIGQPAWSAWWYGQPCPRCHTVGLTAEIPGRGGHFATAVCANNPDCELKETWVTKPRSIGERKRRRPAKPHDGADADRCIFCGGIRADLERLGRTLHVCHIIDRAELIDAGQPPDKRDNEKLQCNFCHEIEQAVRRDLKRRLSTLDAFNG